jgi:hypothetical protein
MEIPIVFYTMKDCTDFLDEKIQKDIEAEGSRIKTTEYKDYP